MIPPRSPIYWLHCAVSAYLVLRSNFFIAAVDLEIEAAALPPHIGTAISPYTPGTLPPMPSHSLVPSPWLLPIIASGARLGAPSSLRPASNYSPSPSSPSPVPLSPNPSPSQPYISLFNELLPAGGLVSVPLAGWCLEAHGLPFTFALTLLLCALCSALQLCTALLPLPAQVGGRRGRAASMHDRAGRYLGTTHSPQCRWVDAGDVQHARPPPPSAHILTSVVLPSLTLPSAPEGGPSSPHLLPPFRSSPSLPSPSPVRSSLLPSRRSSPPSSGFATSAGSTASTAWWERS